MTVPGSSQKCSTFLCGTLQYAQLQQLFYTRIVSYWS